ncbi:hypothetical protein [Cellulosimicrobium cellulans]|uniref:hypothetical protein n=1 Tax=Cellulosimicrobium cellulans TaxID=1710 RepID=UPI0037FDF2C1
MTIQIRDAIELADQPVSVVVWAQDSVSQHWIGTAHGVQLDASGNGAAEFTSGFAVGDETAIWVTELATEGRSVRFEFVSFAIIDSPVDVSDDNAVERFNAIVARQDARYNVPIEAHGGGGEASGEHRALYIVDQLLITEPIRFPGLTVRAIPNRPSGMDFHRAVSDAAERANWPGRPPEAWSRLYGAQHPMVEIEIPRILADDYLAAGEIADRTVGDVLDVLTIARGSRGKPVVALIESRTEANGAHPRFRFHSPMYRGNLATGVLAGESAHDILRMYGSLHADQRVRLGVAMYCEAVAETDLDARYYRYWSMVELLSQLSNESPHRVQLEDGTYWPDGGTSNQAAPGVYELIQLSTVGFHRASLGTPAQSLYELVRAWYGRRNATVHYGRFIPGDSAQKATKWYDWARLTTEDLEPLGDRWIAAVRGVCELVLRHQLLLASSKRTTDDQGV